MALYCVSFPTCTEAVLLTLTFFIAIQSSLGRKPL